MKQNISVKLLAITAVLLISHSCNNREDDKVYCQGQVIRDIIQEKNHDEVSRTFEIACSGDCPNKKPCAIITVPYNPSLPNGLTKKQFCGCEGDTIPRWCEIILYTYQIGGRTVQQADCTPFNSCPVKTDSCIQQNRETVDTIKSVDDHTDSLYHYHTIITCECMNRKGQ